MTILAIGKQTGTLPAPTGAYLGLVHTIKISADPSASGHVSILQGTTPIHVFNTPGPTGALDPPYVITSGNEENSVDPSQFGISAASPGDGAFVVYFTN